MIGQGLAACCGLGLLAWLGTGLGRVVLRGLGVPRATLQDSCYVLAALGLGWGSISLALLGLGAVGAYRPVAFGGLLLLAAAGVGAGELRSVVQAWRQQVDNGRQTWSRLSKWERTALGLIGLHALVSLVAAWAPPTFWDALAYHIGLPQLFLRYHQVVGVDGGNTMAASHLGTQLLYGIGLGWGSEVWPATLHWGYGVLSAVSVYAIGRAWWHPSAGVWAASLLYLTPLFNTLGGGPLIDLALIWYACLTFWALGAWLETRHRRLAILAGLLAGCTAMTKISGMAILALAACVVLCAGAGDRRRRGAWSAAGWVLLAGGLVAGPWLLKSYVEYGTPWYLIEVSRTMGLERTLPVWQTQALSDAGSGVWRLLGQFLCFPVTLTLRPALFDGWRFSAGPWLVSLVPLVWLCRPDRRVGLLGVCGGAVLAGGFLASFAFNRLLAPAYPAVALIGGYVMWQSAAWGPRVQRCLAAVVCLFGALNGGLLLAQDVGRLPVVVGLESRAAYLTRRIDSFAVVDYANRTLPPAAVVCAMDPRVFYLQRDYRIGDPGYQMWLGLEQYPSVDRLWQTLRAAGVTHLLINWPYTRRDQNVGLIGVGLREFNALWAAGLAARCRVLQQVGDVALYELMDGAGALMAPGERAPL